MTTYLEVEVYDTTIMWDIEMIAEMRRCLESSEEMSLD